MRFYNPRGILYSLDFIGGILQADASNNATRQNAANVANTNAQNLLLSLMSRGMPLSQAQADALGVPGLAGQSSAILPYYLSDIEKATGANAGQLALALQKAAPTVGDYSQAIAPYLAMAGQSKNLAGQVLSGDMTKQMLSEAQPTQAARLDVANVQKNAALEQLDKTLNDIDTIQARKGYSGDSYGNRLMKFNARAGIMSGAAGNIAGAKLANAQETQGIQQQGRQMQLGSLMLPEQLASGELGMMTAPTSAASSTFNQSMQPLSSFNIGNHPFQQQNMPIVDPTSATGLAFSGAASGANSAMTSALKDYFARQQASSGYTSQTPSAGAGEGGAAFDGSTGGAGFGGGSGAGVGADTGGELSAPAYGG